jgi:hypothetical protein
LSLSDENAAISPAEADTARETDMLAVVDHHEARLYSLRVGEKGAVEQDLRPYDPHHFLHHFRHKDQSKEKGQKAHEDPKFYEQIAHALAPASRIVLVGHGEGASNAAHHLQAYLQAHHHLIAERVIPISADLPALTEPQLLALGRRTLE